MIDVSKIPRARKVLFALNDTSKTRRIHIEVLDARMRGRWLDAAIDEVQKATAEAHLKLTDRILENEDIPDWKAYRLAATWVTDAFLMITKAQTAGS